MTSKERITQLEEEGDLAADYLEELLDIADIEGDIEIDVENDRASVAIVAEHEGSSLAKLVGDDGAVLDALQELTRLAVQTSTGERTRMMLDVDGYRVGRRAELRVITEEAISQVRAHNERVALDPMNPFERKVCHDVISEAGLISESEGVEPTRRVVVIPVSADDE